jgi:two-component system sensor histidine kinase UhpB
MKGGSRRGLTLQLLLVIVLPLTLLLIAIAVASVAIHQQAMRAALPEAAWKTATSPGLELTLVAPLALIGPLLFALAALWFAARQVVRPLQELESKAAAVAAGDYGAIQEPVGGIAEVQHLQAELAEMARQVQASHQGLHDYIGVITAAQEEERLRLARELHDETIQELIVLKQRVQRARKIAGNGGAERPLAELEDQAESTIENVRRFTRALRPIYLEDLGLVPALEMLARETTQAAGLEVEFQAAGREERLAPARELAIYRIVQQALSNVVRHAHAQRASLTVDFRRPGLRVDVQDDGVGFHVPRNATDLAPAGHFGLLGMRERADLIGARFDVESAPGRGTRVSILLPLPA